MELAIGPAEHCWQDQQWNLERNGAVAARKFHIDCQSASVCRLMQRHGWSWQSPARRITERDEPDFELRQ
ncbi:helix-turn-helix domain-containing protein [Streptomyces chartreusis]|uniref:Winged helix-turn-helix domain-containing protein n=1 Tax=Streptomyces chartreusis TaxID=1969 RepID=A0A7I0NSE6_STRCX|nr:winged helix-turn-helix domain-containing protein [Streptomyces chartreusis]